MPRSLRSLSIPQLDVSKKMKFLSSIFGRKKNDFPNESIWKKLEEGKYEEVISAASPHLNSTDKNEVKEANKLIGMSYFRDKNYEASVSFFEAATEHKTETNDWFNVMTSSVLSKKIEKGKKAFSEYLRIQKESGYKQEPTLPQARQYYACALRDVGEYDLALEQIEELREIYEELKITDDTFVYIRGVPFLSHTMNVAIDVFRGLGSDFDSMKWIDDFSKKLDQEGQEYLNEVKKKLEC